jgi:hypothetical protein
VCVPVARAGTGLKVVGAVGIGNDFQPKNRKEVTANSGTSTQPL